MRSKTVFLCFTLTPEGNLFINFFNKEKNGLSPMFHLPAISVSEMMAYLQEDHDGYWTEKLVRGEYIDQAGVEELAAPASRPPRASKKHDMLTDEELRHAQTLEAAEELVDLLKKADDYSMDDVGKALADIAYDARLHQIGHAIMGVMCGELKVILQFPEVPPFAFGDQKKSA